MPTCNWLKATKGLKHTTGSYHLSHPIEIRRSQLNKRFGKRVLSPVFITRRIIIKKNIKINVIIN